MHAEVLSRRVARTAPDTLGSADGPLTGLRSLQRAPRQQTLAHVPVWRTPHLLPRSVAGAPESTQRGRTRGWPAATTCGHVRTAPGSPTSTCSSRITLAHGCFSAALTRRSAVRRSSSHPAAASRIAFGRSPVVHTRASTRSRVGGAGADAGGAGLGRNWFAVRAGAGVGSQLEWAAANRRAEGSGWMCRRATALAAGAVATPCAQTGNPTLRPKTRQAGGVHVVPPGRCSRWSPRSLRSPVARRRAKTDHGLRRQGITLRRTPLRRPVATWTEASARRLA